MRMYAPPIRVISIGILLSICLPGLAETLSVEQAETIALDLDPGYQGLVKQSRAFEDKAVADSQLPDPTLMAGWLNLPVEGNFDEEPMNQVRLGVKQMFPAGDTLDVKKNLALADAGRVRQQAVTRRLSVLQETRNAWLEAHYWEAALLIVKENEPLFEQLRDVTASFYRTGRKGLDDVVRAELEVQRLKDREVMIIEKIEKQRAFLSRWIGDEESEKDLPADLPAWNMNQPDRAVARERITRHPLVLAIDKQVERLQEGVQLAREQYKPGWSLELGYAFRDATRPNGVEVSDVASIVASMDLPLFTKNRQDRRVSSASQQFNAGLDQRLDLLYSLNARLASEFATLERVNDRIALFDTMILPQTYEQAQAALMAYKAEQSDFTEVMRSHIAQLESTLEFHRLQTDRLKSIATLRYLLPPETDLARATADFASGEAQ